MKIVLLLSVITMVISCFFIEKHWYRSEELFSDQLEVCGEVIKYEYYELKGKRGRAFIEGRLISIDTGINIDEFVSTVELVNDALDRVDNINGRILCIYKVRISPKSNYLFPVRISILGFDLVEQDRLRDTYFKGVNTLVLYGFFFSLSVFVFILLKFILRSLFFKKE
jgi:hypothetical protein